MVASGQLREKGGAVVDALFKSTMFKLSRTCQKRVNSSKYVNAEMMADLTFLLGKSKCLPEILRCGLNWKGYQKFFFGSWLAICSLLSDCGIQIAHMTGILKAYRYIVNGCKWHNMINRPIGLPFMLLQALWSFQCGAEGRPTEQHDAAIFWTLPKPHEFSILVRLDHPQLTFIYCICFKGLQGVHVP